MRLGFERALPLMIFAAICAHAIHNLLKYPLIFDAGQKFAASYGRGLSGLGQWDRNALLMHLESPPVSSPYRRFLRGCCSDPNLRAPPNTEQPTVK